MNCQEYVAQPSSTHDKVSLDTQVLNVQPLDNKYHVINLNRLQVLLRRTEPQHTPSPKKADAKGPITTVYGWCTAFLMPRIRILRGSLLYIFLTILTTSSTLLYSVVIDSNHSTNMAQSSVSLLSGISCWDIAFRSFNFLQTDTNLQVRIWTIWKYTRPDILLCFDF